MRNLAGDDRCDASIHDELEAAGVPIVEGERRGVEVKARLTGKLGPFTFTRAWYYWVVSGPVPLAVAEEMYADPIGKRDVRVAGHCACPPPADWADHFDADGKQLRPIDSDDYRRISTKPWPEGLMGEIYAKIEATCRFVENPRASAARSIVDTYHIDSAAGLRLFVETMKRHGLAEGGAP